MIASGGAGEARHLARRVRGRRRGGAHRVDRARAARAAARAEGRAEGGRMERQDLSPGELVPAIVQDADDAVACSCSPGWTTRRCGARARAARRGSGAARGRSTGTRARRRGTRSRSRRSATTATATRSCCASSGRPGLPHGRRVVLCAVALAADRRACGDAARGVVRRRRCSTPAPPAARRRWARKASRRRSRRVAESDERLVEELADLWFHSYVLLAARGLDPERVEEELRRHAGE